MKLTTLLLATLFFRAAHTAELSPPTFTSELEIKAPSIDAPVLEHSLDTATQHSAPMPSEHGDMTVFRAAQRRVADEKAKRKIKPLRYIDYSKQPQFAHHCVKLKFDAQHKPLITNECKSEIKVAYCWQGVSQIGGGNDCRLNQFALSNGGEIYGPVEQKAAFGLFMFACTSTGTPTDLRFNPDKLELMGQCFW